MLVSEALFYMKLIAAGKWNCMQRGKNWNRYWDQNTIPLLKNYVKQKTDAAKTEWEGRSKKNKGRKRGPWIRALIERKKALKGVVVPWRRADDAPPVPPPAPPVPPPPPPVPVPGQEPQGPPAAVLSKRELQLQAAMRRAVLEEEQRRYQEMMEASRNMVMLAIEDIQHGMEAEEPPIPAPAVPVEVAVVSDDEDDGFAPAASAPSRPAPKARPKGHSQSSPSTASTTTFTESRRFVPRRRIKGKTSPPKDPQNPDEEEHKDD